MAIRSLHGLSANFTLTPPLFKPPRYGPVKSGNLLGRSISFHVGNPLGGRRFKSFQNYSATESLAGDFNRFKITRLLNQLKMKQMVHVPTRIDQTLFCALSLLLACLTIT
jgi:hypothetical protein